MAWPSVRTVNCNRLSKIALKASIPRPRPDGCTSAAWNYHNKAWSVRTLKANVRTVELVHAISIYEAWSSGPWRLTSRRLNLVCMFLSNPEWCPDGITTSSGQMCWNTGIFSNSEERPDGCNLELFEVSRHWWASGRNTTSSGRLTGNRNKSLKTSQNLLEEHSWRVDSG